MAGGIAWQPRSGPRDMALLNLQLQLAAPPWRPRLHSAPQMRGREQQADTARRKRSALARPPGSGQRAGAAQGLWGSSTTGRGQHHLDRSLGVGLPRGVDGHRLGPRSGPDPVADHLATQQQRFCRSALIGRPSALGEQRPGGHPDRGQPKHSPQVEGKAGAAGWSRPVALTSRTSGAIGRARAACSSSGPSRRASRVGRYGPPADPLTVTPASRRRRWVTAAPANPRSPAAPAPWTRSKQTKQPPIRNRFAGGCQRSGVSSPEGVLQLGELVSGGRPGRHTR